MQAEHHARMRLNDMVRDGLYRSPPVLQGRVAPEMRHEGRVVLCFCSNNYLGLADEPALQEASIEAVREHGLGAGSSRLVSGSLSIHCHAEMRLAEFVRHPAAVLFSSGYAANVGLISTLCGSDSLIFSDQLNHASLIDGARLSRARKYIYPHKNLDALRQLLLVHRKEAAHAFVVSDAVFSMDGDAAPVVGLKRLCEEFEASLIVDEAHALGVVGPQGRGLCYDREVVPDVLVGTLGKSFGLSGAFIASSLPVVDLLRNRARSYVYTTAISPALAGAIPTAIDMVEQADGKREQLAKHVCAIREALRHAEWGELGGAGVDACDQSTSRHPIIPFIIGDEARTMAASRQLWEQGIFVQGIRPPTVPPGTSRLRIVPSATHLPAQVERLIQVLGVLSRTTLC